MNAWRKGGLDGLFGLAKKASTRDLKILIVSTPKTGNTWLKSLLASLYDLPIVSMGMSFDPAAAEAFGPRWITHQHYMCDANLLSWAKQHKVVLLTTIRHPGDVLVSLYHYVHNYHTTKAEDFGEKLTALSGDTDGMAEQTIAFVEDFFFFLLNISVTWIYAGESHIVRYEDLWRDPVGTLTTLADRIHPASRDAIERAVELNDIDLVRKLSGKDAKFFRQGGVGGWATTIPAPIIERLRHLDPYPALFAAQGYTLDDDPLLAAPPAPRPAHNPFRDTGAFDNGVSVPPIAVRLYLRFDSDEARRRWPDATDAAPPDSFYAWLKAPAEGDPQGAAAAPLISNLAAYLYEIHPQKRRSLAELFDRDRVEWAFWFVRNATKEYAIDDAFVAPVRASLVAWLDAPAPGARDRGDAQPPITNFAAYIYGERPDVQAVYPDIYGKDGVGYLMWMLENGLREHKMELIFVQLFRDRFLAWANAPAPDVPQDAWPDLLITQLAANLHRARPDLQKTFPDPYDAQRLDYVTWFVGRYGWVPGITRSTIRAWAQGCAKDANALGKKPADA